MYHGNDTLAYISALAFSLSPASMFISSFYPESLFALLTFTGMLCLSRQQYIRASIVWGVASATRSHAILYSGYFIYELVLQRFIQERSAKVRGLHHRCFRQKYCLQRHILNLLDIFRMQSPAQFWLWDAQC